MSTPSAIPDDQNGAVLRRMLSQGDDLTQPRQIDFCHIFPERRQALAFAELLDDPQFEVCISYYQERALWQVVVQRFIVPSHREITALEFFLSSHAVSVGGQADGWGCMLCAPPAA